MTAPADIKAETILKEIQSYINNEVSHIDALVYYAEKYDIELYLIGEIIRRSPVLKSKVREDAERLNLLERTVRLPI